MSHIGAGRSLLLAYMEQLTSLNSEIPTCIHSRMRGGETKQIPCVGKFLWLCRQRTEVSGDGICGR